MSFMSLLHKEILSFYTYLTEIKTYFEQIQILAKVKSTQTYFHEQGGLKKSVQFLITYIRFRVLFYVLKHKKLPYDFTMG